MSEYAYSLSNLTADLELPAHVVRTKLRGLKVEKNDGKYQWSKKAEYNEVLKLIKADNKEGSKSNGKAKAEPKEKVKTKKAKEKAPKNKDAGAAPENKGKKKKKKKAA